MARHLHTAVGDEINRIANGDPERAAEMRMESQEYRDEVMGRFDYDDGGDDYDDQFCDDGRGFTDDEGDDGDYCEECGSGVDPDDGSCPNRMCPTNDGTPDGIGYDAEDAAYADRVEFDDPMAYGD